MKLLQHLFFTLVLGAAVVSSVNAQNNRQLPSVEVANLDGKKVNVKDYGSNGKISVFSFWATWCAPCKKELVNLAEVYDEWKEAYNVEIIAVSTDDQRTVAKVKPYVNGQAWEFDVLLDTNEDLKRALNFQTVPYTIVADMNGNIIYEHSGYVEGDELELEKVLQKLNGQGE